MDAMSDEQVKAIETVLARISSAIPNAGNKDLLQCSHWAICTYKNAYDTLLREKQVGMWKAHVPVTSEQHDASKGLLHGYCERCRLPWPCPYSPESTWIPTKENINELPKPIRHYVMQLETKCDHAGDLRKAVLLQDTVDALQQRLAAVETERDERLSQLLYTRQERDYNGTLLTECKAQLAAAQVQGREWQDYADKLTAQLEAWLEYAKTQGIDVEAMRKNVSHP